MKLAMTFLSLLLALGTSGCGFFSPADPDQPLDTTAASEMETAPTVTIDAVVPDQVGPLGGTTVTITGTGFHPEGEVFFGDLPAVSTLVVSETNIEAVAPPLVAGKYHVWVRQPGSQWASLFFGLTVAPLDLAFAEAPAHAFTPFDDAATSWAVTTDLDGDGTRDIVLVADHEMRFLRGQGNGNFTLQPPEMAPEGPLRFPSIPGATTLLSGDWNGDKRVDLFVTGQTNALLLQQVDGRFATPAEETPGLTDEGLFAITGDLNGDGLLDILLATTTGHHYLINQPLEPGTFQLAPDLWWPQVDEIAGSAALGDFDRDGDLDLVTGAISATGGQMVRLYLNDQGIFTAGEMGAIPPIGEPVTALVALNIDGDQDLDLYLSCEGQDVLLRNDGFAHFFNDSTLALPVDNLPGGSVTAGDLDRDGFPDLVLGHSGAQNRIYLNDGKGHFRDETPRLPMVADDTTHCLVADADGNGTLDIFFFGASGTGNSLLFALAAEAQP
jgi:hypothetical protein